MRALIQARRWHELLASGAAPSIEALPQRESVCPIFLGQLLPLECLVPDLTEAILDGRQPPGSSLIALIRAGLPLRWNHQRALFTQFHQAGDSRSTGRSLRKRLMGWTAPDGIKACQAGVVVKPVKGAVRDQC